MFLITSICIKSRARSPLHFYATYSLKVFNNLNVLYKQYITIYSYLHKFPYFGQIHTEYVFWYSIYAII